MSISFQKFMQLQVMAIDCYARHERKSAAAVAGEWIQRYAAGFRNLFEKDLAVI